jgi:UDP-N-acetylmuramate--alanine ligase
MSGFVKALQLADKVYLLDIYPAREEPIEGVTSSVLQSSIGNMCSLIERQEFESCLKRNDNNGTVNLVMGAGSIGSYFQEFIAKEVAC